MPAGGGGQGRHFSYGELEGLWIAAGGPRRLAPTMAAIAEAESRGDSGAHNPSGATGLWQILGNPFPGNAYDPMTNARMAVAKWKSQGLGAWATWPHPARRMIRKGVPPVPPGGVTRNIGSVYGNPLRRVSGLTPERVDAGVDYSGAGPVYALGPGIITYAGTGNTGWGPSSGGLAPGGYVKERITEGPLKNRSVYVAEAFYPSVRAGQHVGPDTEIGRMAGGIETGFAAPGPGTAPLGHFLGSAPTAAGVLYSDILHAEGAPPGTDAAAKPTGADLPWMKTIYADIKSGQFGGGWGPGGGGGGGLFGGLATALGDINTTLGDIAKFFEDLDAAALWLVNPANWVRIICGVAGGALVLGGIWQLSHAGGQLPVPGVAGDVSVPKPAALPMGIAQVTFGAVLLFVAFHNLPGNPASLTELLGSLRDQSQAALAGQPTTGVGP